MTNKVATLDKNTDHGRKTTMNFLNKLAMIILFGAITPFQHGQTGTENLQMFVSPRTSSMCLGAKAVVLDVLVVNQGSTDASLDTGKFRASFAFSEISGLAGTIGQSRGMAVIPDRLGNAAASHIVILRSKQAFTQELSFSLPSTFLTSPASIAPCRRLWLVQLKGLPPSIQA
jgi:hypothetical protein